MGSGKTAVVKKTAIKQKRRRFRRVIKWGCAFVAVLVFITVLQVVFLRYLNPPFFLINPVTSMVEGFRTRSTEPSVRWCSLEQMSTSIQKAVLSAEDQRFLTHNGFDFIELNDALKDMAMGKGYRGASTLTMQVARTVFLWPDRTWIRKGFEAYYTILLEIFLSKKRILEVYLNTVDWGKGIRGIEAAARTYFHVSPGHVSRVQAALLAAVLPSPHRWSPTNPNARVLRRQKRILNDMNQMALPEKK